MHVDLGFYCLGYISIFFNQYAKSYSLPNSLYAVREPLSDSCDVDRVYVSLLQLVKQHVYMWQDLVKQRQEKTENFIFQHSLTSSGLSLR